MESSIKTVVCPNCGASAHNLHNCEFCGSFLVQRAAEGKDLSSYVKAASEYKNEGVKKVVRKYTNLVKEFPSDPFILTIYDNSGNGDRFAFMPSLGSKKKATGIKLILNYSTLKEQKIYGSFINAPVSSVFFKNESMETIDDENDDCFAADFGFDYEEATRVVLQLIELYGIPENEISFSIIWDVDEGNEIMYNGKGVVVRRTGYGKNDFKELDADFQQAVKRGNMLGLAIVGIVAIICAIIVLVSL